MSFGVIHGFDWDEGNWPKCGKHGVSKVEIEFVLGSNSRIFADFDHSKGEERFKAIGANQWSQLIFINFTIRQSQNGSTLIRPISARYMHQEEIDRYEQS